MFKIKNFIIGISINISIVSMVGASGGYYDRSDDRQVRPREQRMVTQPRGEQGRNNLPTYYRKGHEPFRYDMPDPQQKAVLKPQPQAQQQVYKQKPSLPRLQCPAINRIQLTALLAGKPVVLGEMKLIKVTSDNTGLLRKRIQNAFTSKDSLEQKIYYGNIIFEKDILNAARQKGLTLDNQIMEKFGVAYVNDGYCSFTYHPGGKDKDVIAAVVTDKSLMRSGQDQTRMQQQMQNKSRNENFMTSQQGRQGGMSGNYSNNSSSGEGRDDQTPSSDQQILGNLENKIKLSGGDKIRFWNSLTLDEKSMINDLKAKNDNREAMNPYERKIFNDFQKITGSTNNLNKPDPYPRRGY